MEIDKPQNTYNLKNYFMQYKAIIFYSAPPLLSAFSN